MSTNNGACADVRTLIGVYVLGAIEPAERALVDSHLSRCRRCRDELVALAGLPALLGRATEHQLAELVAPTGAPLEMALARAAMERRSRRRRSRGLVAAVAAAAAILAGGGVFGGMRVVGGYEAAPAATSTPAPTHSSAAPVEDDGETIHGKNGDMHARITMWSEDWGTAFAVKLTGAPVGSSCRLIAVGKDGRRDVAGSWRIKYEGAEQFRGSSMIPRDRLASIEVRTMEGERLLTVPA